MSEHAVDYFATEVIFAPGGRFENPVLQHDGTVSTERGAETLDARI
jgi:hypothetical protein